MQDFLLVVLGLIITILVLLVAVAAFLYWRIQRSDEKKLAKRIAKLPFLDKVSLAGSLFRDGRIPIAPRVIALGLVLYIASPIDLLPDFIPVIGYFDDLLIVLVGAGLLLRSIPRYIIEEHVGRYEVQEIEARARLQTRHR
jgi:uncharacterized membrane protein YkvA (DUF1232 family)